VYVFVYKIVNFIKCRRSQLWTSYEIATSEINTY